MRHTIAAVVAAVVLAAATGSVAQPSTGVGYDPTARTAFVNGDSLAVGTRRYLQRFLPNWRLQQSYDISRHVFQGVDVIRQLGQALPPVIVVGLGTNDDPGMVSTFRREVREVMALAGRGRCVVWTSIVRPAYEGVSYDGLNGVLTDEAARRDNLIVVDWVGLAAAHPAWFGPDGVHPTPEGYWGRAAAIARAVKSCHRELQRNVG
jgi:lysophospholipase L1-like esterase